MATSSSSGSGGGGSACSSSSGKSPPSPSHSGAEPKTAVTNRETFEAALDAVIKNLLDDEAFSFIVNCGRQLRNGELEALGVFSKPCPDREVIDAPGVDIFGQPLSKKTNFECVCPKCQRTLAAARFAPHLEKCMGMGRNSSRIASLKNRRLAAASNSNSIIGATLAISGRDVNFANNANSNSSDGSNDSCPLKNGEQFSEDDHFEEDEDDEDWTIEKKKKTKKSSEKVTPKKKGALSRVKNSERRNKRGGSPSISITNSPMSVTSSNAMDIANYEELTNDSFSSYL